MFKKIADFNDPNAVAPPQARPSVQPAAPVVKEQTKPQAGFSDPNSKEPVGKVPGRTQPSQAIVPQQSAPQSSFKENIMEMQQALINLANAIGAHDFASSTPSASGEQYNAFNKMFSNQYINEYGDRSQTDFRKFINVIGRIGHGGANKPDGIWGPKTDTAIENVRDFGRSLAKMLEDMGIEYKDLKSDAPALNFGLPPSGKTDPEFKKEISKKMTSIINRVIKLYEFFKENVLEHKDHKEYLKGKPLLTLQAPELDPKDAEVLKANMGKEIPSVLNGKPIRLFDLESLHRFQDLLKESKIEPTPENTTAVIKRIQEDLAGFEAREKETALPETRK